MSDESKTELVLRVAPLNSAGNDWIVFWEDNEPEFGGGELAFENRDDAIANAKDQAKAIKNSVRIVAHEGLGYEAEEWLIDEYVSFVDPDDLTISGFAS